MAENDIIQQEEIRLENELYAWSAHLPQPQSPTDKTKSAETIEDEPKRPAPNRPQEPESALNVRQKEAWAVIRKQGTVTRKDYQELVGGNLPTRTAIYDLQDFVKRGLLVKQGKGPSTRYEVIAKD